MDPAKRLSANGVLQHVWLREDEESVGVEEQPQPANTQEEQELPTPNKSVEDRRASGSLISPLKIELALPEPFR